MKIDEFKKELGNKNFYKLCVYGILVLLTIIAYFIKGSNIEININWELLGFVGVIITIIYTEKSRIKQNQYDYKKEKITDEQIEFGRVVKEKVDLLDFAQIMIDLFFVDTTSYRNVTFKVDVYKSKLATMQNDIIWYYKDMAIIKNSEIDKFLDLIDGYRVFYTEKLEEYNTVILKYGILDFWNNYKGGNVPSEFNIGNKTPREFSTELVNMQKEIFMKIIEYRNDNMNNLYKKAHLVIEERDNFMKEKLKEII